MSTIARSEVPPMFAAICTTGHDGKLACANRDYCKISLSCCLSTLLVEVSLLNRRKSSCNEFSTLCFDVLICSEDPFAKFELVKIVSGFLSGTEFVSSGVLRILQ